MAEKSTSMSAKAQAELSAALRLSAKRRALPVNRKQKNNEALTPVSGKPFRVESHGRPFAVGNQRAFDQAAVAREQC